MTYKAVGCGGPLIYGKVFQNQFIDEKNNIPLKYLQVVSVSFGQFLQEPSMSCDLRRVMV